jgi:hypothetical protein
MLREWATGIFCGSSVERADQLEGWLDRYNYRRKHGFLGQTHRRIDSTSCSGTTCSGTTCLGTTSEAEPA